MPDAHTPPSVNSASPAAGPGPADEINRHNEWFTTTPDPWHEMARLEFGGDRTFASAIEQMVTNAEPGQRPALESKLLEVLARPELTDAARQFVCRLLGLIGSKACLPAVGRLLDDGRTADEARMALDPVTDSGVDEAYRAALDKLRGPALAGLIGSIAGRGDKAACDELTRIARDRGQESQVRETAARSVQRLGGG